MAALIGGIIVDILNIIFQFISAFGSILGPSVFALIIIAISRKHFILAFLGTSVLSSLISVICWIFPNHTAGLAAGNQLLNLATIQNAVDLIIYAQTSSWSIGWDFAIVGVGSLLIFLYIKLVFQ